MEGDARLRNGEESQVDKEVFRFDYTPMPSWPELAWLARCRPGSRVIDVFHGVRVECTEDWFVEAVWTGGYQAGDFDRTDLVAGSGGRSRGPRVVFVSSGATVDRLQSIETASGTCVSNSLACLLAVTGAKIDDSSGRYFWIFRTIVAGIRRYRRRFPTTAGDVQLTYFDNLAWDGRSLEVVPKPGGVRDFATFDRYARFLDDNMAALAANAADPARTRRYELLCTASSGYDSSTVTVVARRAGARQVLCFDQAGRGLDDSGEPLARWLGMEPVVIPRGAWMTSAMPEPPFLSSDSHGGDVFYKGAEATLRGKVLLTGYHGDKIWAKDAHHVDENIVRGDQSGLSLTEYRLGAGMIHCPITFWGVRQIGDLHAISNSDEMKPWDVPGDYSRPICRRIVESEGVPREMFGIAKKATWVLLLWNKQFLSPDSMRDYLSWLQERRRHWMRSGRIPPLMNRRLDTMDVEIRKFAGKLSADEKSFHGKALHSTGLVRVLWRLSEGPPRLRRYLFPWAMQHRLRAYPAP